MPGIKKTHLTAEAARIENITNISLLVGRNGAGKSRFLRLLDAGLQSSMEYSVRYISPERTGIFQKQGNVETYIAQNPDWLQSVRGKNQAENFKQASAYFLRNLEIAYLRRLQDTPEIRLDPERNFRSEYLDRINSLLANISINMKGADFVFMSQAGSEVSPDNISSGESEAVSLASEIMYFFATLDSERFNVLLLDEPDVHLHPDLQFRLARLIVGELNRLSASDLNNVVVIIATHSTPLICAFGQSGFTSIGVKHFDNDVVVQKLLDDQIKKTLPFFGHPLSLSLANEPVLILEGQDDERVWQQASRSSKGRIRVFPVLSNTVDEQSDLEIFIAEMLVATYDQPYAFSVRDGDGKTEKLNDVGPVKRFRLNCYAIENVLMTDEALKQLGTDWSMFCAKAKVWVDSNSSHKDVQLVESLVASPNRLRDKKIKSIRQLVCSFTGTTKPWEVVVGQAIASIESLDTSKGETGKASLVYFLGPELAKAVLGLPEKIETGTAAAV